MSSESRDFDSNRAQGVLVGLAAGDKNLGPIEIALMNAESLITKGEFDLSDITDHWLNWWLCRAWNQAKEQAEFENVSHYPAVHVI